MQFMLKIAKKKFSTIGPIIKGKELFLKLFKKNVSGRQVLIIFLGNVVPHALLQFTNHSCTFTCVLDKNADFSKYLTNISGNGRSGL